MIYSLDEENVLLRDVNAIIIKAGKIIENRNFQFLGIGFKIQTVL